MAWDKKTAPHKADADAQSETAKENRNAVNKFRYEVAEDISPAVRRGTGGASYGKADYTSGYLVKKMIEAQERQMQNQGK